MTTLDLKQTLNLPKTDFPMKANLPTKEPAMLARWEKIALYEKILQARLGRTVFVLHDGPPYANGNIHLGHALNKILKDLVVKSKTMAGYRAPYLPGWDCHGLPIEIKVDQNLGEKKASMTQVQIRQACRKYAEKYVQVQKEEFKRLGIFGQWERPYLTMSYHYEAEITRALAGFVERGNVYRGLKPVLWCTHCLTALAEAEVEYENHQSPSIFVKFPMIADSVPWADPHPDAAFAVIWTTTPWTLPANLAIAVHPDFDYSLLKVKNEHFWIATQRIEAVMRECGITDWTVVKTVKGSTMLGHRARHPWIDRDSPFIAADYVSLDQGTGLVHTAPGHGQEDYVSGLKYDLEIYNPVDHRGCFAEEIEFFKGQQVLEANPKIVQLLKERGLLLHSDRVIHSYPHCWRCHNPVIFRATPQWFIAMDASDLRARALAELKKVKWIPEWGEERIANMISSRPDWCISRQRVWGVPIVAFYCTACNEILASEGVIRHVAEIFEREGADAWYARGELELLPPNTVCSRCGAWQFKKEFDILDVWFDSGSSLLAVLGQQGEQKDVNVTWPADMYLEGNDQYRGWFQSSLLVGVGTRNGAPYRSVVTHGMTLDAEGKAMSKSVGNVIAPQKIIKQSGAEILRLWVCSIDYREDARLSPEILSRLQEAYRKIRNTARFILGNLYDFEPAKHRLALEDLWELDRWALARTFEVSEKAKAGFESYQFHVVYHLLHQFCVSDLSSFYLDILKDRLYTRASNSRARRSAQTALFEVLDCLCRLLAPLLPFTADEIWLQLHDQEPGDESVHLKLFRNMRDYADNTLLVRWERLLQLREEIYKKLEEARQAKLIGTSLEAQLVLVCGEHQFDYLKGFSSDLRYIFIVSEVALEESADFGPDYLEIKVQPAEGKKCERCWNYSSDVGINNQYPSVCSRCVAALEEMVGASGGVA
ncbi:MAG: isoleucine--tRNA ligase [Acidobacteria bacterium]|nr:isoleucine--tRNA ligase [Acidobacteriota bacterium]